MKSSTEIANEQKEKWNGLEIIVEAISRKRELTLNPQVVPEVKNAKCGMKVNPWNAATYLQHKHIMNSGIISSEKHLFQKPKINTFTAATNTNQTTGNPDLFAPAKSNTIYKDIWGKSDTNCNTNNLSTNPQADLIGRTKKFYFIKYISHKI